jgi:RimJ/RimL family protein N-acetyltransferase
VTLPLYTDLGDEQVERVVEAVIEFGGQPRRRTARIAAEGVLLREIASVDLDVIDAWRKQDGHRLGDLASVDLFEWFNRYLGTDDRVFLFFDANGRAAGAIGISYPTDGEGEIDRLLIPATTRPDLAGAALRALLLHLSANGASGSKLERAQIGIAAGQPELQALLEQAGLRPEGVQRSGFKTATGRCDRVLLGWLRE